MQNKKKCLVAIAVLALVASTAWTKPTKKEFNVPAKELFSVAYKVVLENYQVKNADKDNLYVSFETPHSFSRGTALCSFSVEKKGEGSLLIINTNEPPGFSFGAQSVAKKLLKQVEQKLGEMTK